MKKKSLIFIALFLATCMFYVFAAGQDESQEQSASSTDLLFWTATDQSLYQEWINAFEAVNPNVNIELVQHPWNDYWTKLPLALQSGNGPDIFYQHIAFLQNTLPHAASYDETIIDYNQLIDDFSLITENMIEDKLYYAPLATMTGSVFYNREILAEAGVTDIPDTWDEFIDLAKELTQFTDSGEVSRAGFSFNGMVRELYWALNYQQGLPMFYADGKATVDHPTSKKTLEFIGNIYDQDKVGSLLLSGNAWDQFANGQAAMVYVYGWVYGWMAENGPNVDFGIAPLPSFDRKPVAFDRNNVELLFGISKKTDEEKADVAQNFVKFILDNDYLLADYAARKGGVPTKIALRKSPVIANHQLFSILNRFIDKTIYPGAFPAAIEPGYNRLFDNIYLNEMDMDKAITLAKKEIDEAIADTGFVSAESLYPDYEEFDF